MNNEYTIEQVDAAIELIRAALNPTDEKDFIAKLKMHKLFPDLAITRNGEPFAVEDTVRG